jgi:predicted transposase YbfD/YdcC
VERRTLTSTTDLNGFLDWPGVQQVCQVQRERVIAGRRECETVYYITSLSRSRVGPAHLLELVRGHWGAIENRLHYVRDVVLGEDASTIRTGHAPQNLATLRNPELAAARRPASNHRRLALLRAQSLTAPCSPRLPEPGEDPVYPCAAANRPPQSSRVIEGSEMTGRAADARPAGTRLNVFDQNSFCSCSATVRFASGSIVSNFRSS